MKRKDICPQCGKKMKKTFEDCPFCGGEEVYECPNCYAMCDIKTGEEI